MKTAPGAGVVQNLETTRSDYQILATTEGTGTAFRILGISFPWGASRAFVSGNYLPIFKQGSGGSGMKACFMATYDALNKVPEADTFIPLTYTLEKNGIPGLFRTFTANVKGKAIKIKTDAELKK